MHDMQDRQRSKCVTVCGLGGAPLSSISLIKSMRPRGESFSSCSSTYVGQPEVQKP